MTIQQRIENAVSAFIGKESKVFGRDKYSSTGRVVAGTVKEMMAAHKALESDVWMYSAIYAIASSAAMLPFGVHKRKPTTKGGDYVMDLNDPLTKLMARPNEVQTAQEFMEACYWSLELDGILYLEVDGGKGSPQNLYVLPAAKMSPVKDKKRYVVGYEYDLDGQKIPFPLDSIIVHRYHNPNDAYTGMSASTPAGGAINSNIESNLYNYEFYANACVPSGTLETEQKLTTNEADELADNWMKSHKRKGLRHRIAVLWNGIAYKPSQRSPRDMEFIKQKALNREEILAAYGVPPVLVGLLESVNYGNSKEQKKTFWQQTMIPKLAGLSSRFNIEFKLDVTKRKFAYDLTKLDVLQDDQDVRGRVAFNLSKALIMTANEIRRIFYAMEPLPGGIGDEIWVPTNMVPAKLQMSGPVAPAVAPGKPGKPGGPDAASQDDGKKPGTSGSANNKPKKELDPTDEELSEFIKELQVQILV